MDPKTAPKRTHIRFKPDDNTVAYLDLHPEASEFDPQLVGLVLNESYQGASIVVVKTDRLQKGDMCVIQCGKLAPMRAEVKWRTQIDENVIKLGLMYLE